MTDALKKRRGRPAKKKVEVKEEAPAFLDEPKPKKKGGRPKGAKNNDSPVSNVLSPLCKHCGKSGIKITKVMKPILSFATIDGKKYNQLTRKYAFCDKCNKCSILMVRDNK